MPSAASLEIIFYLSITKDRLVGTSETKYFEMIGLNICQIPLNNVKYGNIDCHLFSHVFSSIFFSLKTEKTLSAQIFNNDSFRMHRKAL